MRTPDEKSWCQVKLGLLLAVSIDKILLFDKEMSIGLKT